MTANPPETPVGRALQAAGVPFRLFTHAGPVRSLEQAAEERGQSPDQVVRSLLFRLAEDKFVMVLVAGGGQVPWKALRRYLGESRLTTATREELLRVTGYEIGAVAPFGLPQPLRTLADRRIFDHEEISLGSGVRGTTVLLRAADLRAALGEFELIDLQGD